jgi:hypothetical protein
MAIWDILRPFGIFLAIWYVYFWPFGMYIFGHLVCIFLAIWYVYFWQFGISYGNLVYFSRFGTLYLEKSGNPCLSTRAWRHQLKNGVGYKFKILSP